MAEETGVLEHGRDVAGKPPITKDLERSSKLRDALVKKTGSVVRHTLGKPRGEDAVGILKNGIEETRREIRALFPNYPADRLNMLLDLGFGFGRLSKETVMHAQTENIYEKDLSARIQHALSHQILSAAESNEESIISTTYSLVRNLSLLAEKFRGNENSLSRYWKGMRNQVVVINVLQENGLRVFVPDYAQDTSDLADEENDVMELDVRNGIDLIAVSPEGRILLVDAKGRNSKEEQEAIKASGKLSRVDPARERSALLRQTIEQVAQATGADPSETYRLKIVIPTEGRSFVGTDFKTHNHTAPQAQKQSLAQFMNVTPEVSFDIMEQVRSDRDSIKAYSVG